MQTFTDYIPKPWPSAEHPWFDHQETDLVRTADMNVFALLHEQRTGKTRIVYDTACYRYEKGEIDTLIVVAWPLGVHRNWIVDDAPMYIPDRIKWEGLVWESNKTDRVGYRKQLAYMLRYKGLRIISIAAESIITKRVRLYLKELVDQSKGVMLIADEFSFMESVDSERTLVMQRIRRHPNVKIVRILDGTPIGNRGPLGLYSPFLFLDWRIFRQPNFYTFKARYAEWERKDFRSWDVKQAELAGMTEEQIEVMRADELAKGGRGGLVQKRDKAGQPIYKNLDELQRLIAPWSSRVLRADVFPHLKQPIYQSAYVELSSEQRLVYSELQEEYRAELRDGSVIDAEHILTRYIRLQQIASNYFPEHDVSRICAACAGEGCERCDDLGIVMSVEPAIRIDKDNNPRMERLLHEMRRTSDPMLIGAKFRQDAADIMEASLKAGLKAVRYWGNLRQKSEAKLDFQDGRAQFLVGNQFSLSRGHKLTAARSLLFYSHDFTLRTRLQFQDRPVTVDMKHALEIVDVIAVDTVDERIVSSLRANKNLADQITGDPGGVWI